MSFLAINKERKKQVLNESEKGLHNSRDIFPLSSGFELHFGIGDDFGLIVNTNNDGCYKSEWEAKKPQQQIVGPNFSHWSLHHLHIAVHSIHVRLRRHLAAHTLFNYWIWYNGLERKKKPDSEEEYIKCCYNIRKGDRGLMGCY